MTPAPLTARPMPRTSIRPLALLLALALLVAGLLRPSFTPAWPPVTPLATAPAPVSLPFETIKTVGQLPLPLQYAFSRDVGRDNPAYHLDKGWAPCNPVSCTYTLDNPAQQLQATIEAGSLQIRSEGATWALALAGWGRPAAMISLPNAGAPRADANRLEMPFGPLTAWYTNGPLGVQHGWTLDERPQGNGPLQVALRTSGTLRPMLVDGGPSLELRDAGGMTRLRYGGLLAVDTIGKALPATFELRGSVLAITVDDHAAIYPLTIDPWIQTATLTATDGQNGDRLGYSVAVSADGTTVVAGAYGSGSGRTGQGAAYVYVRPGGGWATTATFTAKLTASDGQNDDYLGHSVAVSADGTTVVAGAPYSNLGGIDRGAAYVYVRPGGGWATTATFTAKLTASDGQNGDYLGYSVAVSADGTTVVAGAPYSNLGGIDRGAAYVYVRPGGGWATTAAFTAKLTASDGQNNDYLGWSMAVSADGATVVVGANGSPGGTFRGAAYVYVRPGGGWITTADFTAKLTASDGQDGDLLGASVAVSADGTTVVAGAPHNDLGGADRGAVYVYVRPGGGWATTAAFTAKLTASDGQDGDWLGTSVAVSVDGASITAGAPGGALGGANRGSVVTFQRPRFSLSVTGTPSRGPIPGTFLLTRDVAQGDVTVRLQLGGSAILGTDYAVTGGGVNVAGAIATVQVLSGIITLPLTIIPTTNRPVGQTIVATLLSDPGYLIDSAASSASLTILPSVGIMLAAAPPSAYPLLGTVTVTRGAQETVGALQVALQLGGSSAVLGQDYQVAGATINGVNGAITIPNGAQNASFTLLLLPTAQPASGQQVVVALSTAASYAITGPPDVALTLDGRTPPPWLVLLYLAGDDSDPGSGQTSLTPYLQSLRTRLSANPNARIVVLYDGNQPGDGSITVIDMLGVRDLTEQALAHPDWNAPIERIGGEPELDTGNYLTLQSFIRWSRTTFPGSQHSLLSIVDHGGGWAPELGTGGQPGSGGHTQAGGQRGLSIDHRSGLSLSTRDTSQVFEELGTFGQFDVLFFDACLMGMVESAYQVQPYARYLVAGENLLWSRFPYEQYLRSDRLTASTTPEELARALVEGYNEPTPPDEPFTIAAIDLERLPEIALRTNALADELLKNSHQVGSTITPTIKLAYQASQKFDYTASYQIHDTDAYVDLYDFAKQLAAQGVQLPVQAAAQALRDAIDDGQGGGAVLAIKTVSGFYHEQTEWKLQGAHGLAIYLPLGERDCRPTGTYHTGGPTVIAPCTQVASVDGQPQAEPQLQRYYSKAEQLAFTRDAPQWAQLLLQLDSDEDVVPDGNPTYGPILPGFSPFEVFLPMVQFP